MSKTKSPKENLPDGIYVVGVDHSFSGGGKLTHYLAFDLGNLPPPRNSECLGHNRGGEDACLVYFHKEPADQEYPKMVAWGATSSTNIVQNPTIRVIEKLLLEENEYREARDEYTAKIMVKLAPMSYYDARREVKVKNKLEGLVHLNREINSLYDQYFPSEVPVAEQFLLPPVEMPVDEEKYMLPAEGPPGPRLFSGLLHAPSSKQTRKLRRDIKRARSLIAQRIGYRPPLTFVDQWNMDWDKKGFSDTSSDEEEEEVVPRKKSPPRKKPPPHKKYSPSNWGDYSDEEGFGYVTRRKRKKKKRKSKSMKKENQKKKSKSQTKKKI